MVLSREEVMGQCGSGTNRWMSDGAFVSDFLKIKNKGPCCLIRFQLQSDAHDIQISLVWFLFVLWHINHCKLFNAKSIFIHINCSISNNSD